METTTTVYVVRHAEAAGNIQRIFQGQVDSDISENGALQLEYLKARFAKTPFDVIYSSPLKRAYKTAQAVNAAQGLPIHTRADLMEICAGDMEEKPFARLPELYPKEWHDWDEEPWNYDPPHGESMRQLYARISAAYEDILRLHAGQRIVIVSHGCAIRNLTCYLKGLPVEQLQTIGWADNTSVMKIRREGGRDRILYERDISHLSAELSTLAKQNWWKKVEVLSCHGLA